MKSIKNDFPIFRNNPELIYLDSASTLQKPQVVLDALQHYLTHNYANIHRGKYSLSRTSEELYEQARKTVADFTHAKDASEVIFTGNSTDSANILARSMLRSGWIGTWDNIILSELEHHANVLPWQMVAEQVWAEIRWVPVWEDGDLAVEQIQDLLDENTKVITLSLCSNVTGRVRRDKIKQLCEYINSPSTTLSEGGEGLSSRPLLIVDASQAAAHWLLDVSEIGCDFCFFTGHKLGALTGIWVLWGRQDLLKKLKPGKVWGGAVDEVTKEGVAYLWSPDKFEPGTPNVVGAVSLMEAIKYLNSINVNEIEQSLIPYCLQEFQKLENDGKITLLWWIDGERIGVFTFIYHGNLTQLEQNMQDQHVALRTGTHCTHIYHDWLNTSNKKTCRISLRAYTELSDVEMFFDVLCWWS